VALGDLDQESENRPWPTSSPIQNVPSITTPMKTAKLGMNQRVRGGDDSGAVRLCRRQPLEELLGFEARGRAGRERA
jgi:hypothetical protein